MSDKTGLSYALDDHALGANERLDPRFDGRVEGEGPRTFNTSTRLRLNHVPRFRASHCRNATHFSAPQIVKYPTGLRRKGTS